MGRFLYIIALVAALSLAASCKGGGSAEIIEAETGVPEINEADAIAVDSTEAVTDSIDYSDLSLPPRRFSTKEEALEFMRNSGHWSEYRSGILVKMLDDNFPYADRLLNNRHKYFIVVDKASMNVALFDRYGNRVKTYKMACSRNYGTKHAKADNRTVEGFFTAQGIYDSTDWLFTDDNGHTSKVKGQFGPRFIRLKTDVTSQIGIHGTGSPRSLGLRVSHGCIRIHNEAILELVKYARPGMPILVNPSKRDVAVNTSEGYDVPTFYTGLTPLPQGDFGDVVLPEDTVVSAAAAVDSTAVVPVTTDSLTAVPATAPVVVPDSIVIPTEE